MKDKKYIGKWNCEYCGTIGIDAIVMGSDGKAIRVLSCPNCGANVPNKTKDGGSPYYQQDNKDEWEVLDQKYSHAFGVPNWVCSSCDAENPDISEVKRCLKCGNPKENSDSKRVKIKSGTSPKETLRDAKEFKSEEDLIDDMVTENYDFEDSSNKNKYSHNSKAKIYNRFIKETQTQGLEPLFSDTYTRKIKQPKRNIFTKKFKTILFSTLGTLTLGFFIWFLFIDTIEKFGHIDDKTWSRNMAIEDYRMRDRSAWEDEVPYDGTVYSRTEKVHHYDRVFSHTEHKTREVSHTRQVESGTTNNGDGTFSQNYTTETYYTTEPYTEDVYVDEPRYATWCDYNIMDWEHEKNLKTAGSVKKEINVVPFWHSFTEKKDERVYSKNQKYLILILTDDNKSYSDNYKQVEWEKYKLNQDVKVIVNRVGNVKEMYIVDEI